VAVWAKIKQLKVGQVFILAKTFLWRPKLIIPTYRATTKTLQICNNLFGKAHHQDNTTNAFRHALWNFKLVEYCFRENDSVKDSVAWAKEITHLHEMLSPNPALARAMDLHNNEIGRILFQQEIASEEIIETLKKMMKEAKQISHPEEVSVYTNKLVFIETKR